MRKVLALVIGLLMLGGMMGMVDADDKITIDGDPADWTSDSSGISDNSYAIVDGEWIWKDKTSDENYYFTTPYHDKRVDITEFRVTADNSYLYFLIKFNNLDVVGEDGAPAVIITMDTNQVSGEGETTLLNQYTETSISSDAAWEYLIFVDLAYPGVQDGVAVQGDGKIYIFGSAFDVLSQSGDVSSSSDEFAVSTSYNALEIKVLKSEIGNPQTIRVTLSVLRSKGNGDFWEVTSQDPTPSDVLDCMSDKDYTIDEIQDGSVDYYVDITLSDVPFFSNAGIAAVTLLLVLGAVWFFRRQ